MIDNYPEYYDVLVSESIERPYERLFLTGLLRYHTAIDGIFYQAKTKIAFYRDGHICWGTLLKDTPFQTPFGELAFKQGTVVEFFKDNGTAQKGTLAKNAELIAAGNERFIFKSDTEVTIGVDSCKGTLLSNTILRGTVYQGGTRVEISKSGFVDAGILLHDTSMNTVSGQRVVVQKGQVLSRNGLVYSARLAQDARLPILGAEKPTLLRMGYEFGFGQANSVTIGTLAEDLTICEIALKAGTSFHVVGEGPNSKPFLWKADFGARETSLEARAGTFSFIGEVEFFENRFVKSGILAQDVRINGIKWRKGTYIEFALNGRVALSKENGVTEIYEDDPPDEPSSEW